MSTTAVGQAVLLTFEESAERLRIGRTSMYRLVSTGAIETVTVGRLRRVQQNAWPSMWPGCAEMPSS